jgi:eukaryotic-like serine/threonine-protein kinase
MTSDDQRIGSVLQGRYRVLEAVSSGGIGSVYKAERTQLGRIVAVKFLHGPLANDADMMRRFEQEARLMSRLDHPHCVSVIDFGVSGEPFIVMEFVTGTTLRRLIDDGPVPPRRALAIVKQILAGLAHAHEKGIIHRDMKPANVMLAQHTGTGDHARILDFGLAKVWDAESSTSSVLGTPSYMSPEQASGKKVDGRTDLYATGVILYELLTGEKPFLADQALAVLAMHMNDPPPRLEDKAPRGTPFSEELEELVARCMAKSAEDRFQTPAELAEAIEYLPEWETSTNRPPRPPTAAPRASTAAPRAGTANGARPARAQTLPSSSSISLALDQMVASGVGHPVAARPARSGGGLGWLWFILILGALGGGWWFIGHPGLSSKPAKPAKPGASDTDAKIQQLHELRRQKPKDASIPFQLAAEYLKKDWWAEALAAYHEAIEKNPAYKKNATLQRDVIALLGDERSRDKARVLILTDLKTDASASLRIAAKNHKSADVRRQAAKVADELDKIR